MGQLPTPQRKPVSSAQPFPMLGIPCAGEGAGVMRIWVILPVFRICNLR
jgi:hypothetical protein